MPSTLEVQIENAVVAFERLTRLQVTVHDLCGNLGGRLPGRRAMHTQPLCQLVKAKHAMTCIHFDVNHLRSMLPGHPQGVVKRCHAGIIELVVPSMSPHGIDWILMAGGRRAGSGLRQVLMDSDQATVHGTWTGRIQELPPLDADEAEMLLESLRQLASRLRDLVPPANEQTDADRLARKAPSLITTWIAQHHTQDVSLADLATHLQLSQSRTSAIVRQICDRPFIALLGEARLQTAANMLMQTSLGVAQVARNAGFRNLANFHRKFARHYGSSPAMWRRTRPLLGAS